MYLEETWRNSIIRLSLLFFIAMLPFKLHQNTNAINPSEATSERIKFFQHTNEFFKFSNIIGIFRSAKSSLNPGFIRNTPRFCQRLQVVTQNVWRRFSAGLPKFLILSLDCLSQDLPLLSILPANLTLTRMLGAITPSG